MSTTILSQGARNVKTGNVMAAGGGAGNSYCVPYIVQSATAYAQGVSVTTKACTLPYNTITGNTLVALVDVYNATAPTVTGVASTTGTPTAFTRGCFKTVGTTTTEIWYATITAGGTTPTITATFSAAGANVEITVYEIFGAGVVDVSNAVTGTSSSASVSVTTTVANDFIIGISYGTGGTTSGELGWTGGGALTGNGAVVQYTIGPTAQAYTFTTVGSNATWVACLISFKSTVTAHLAAGDGVTDDTQAFLDAMNMGRYQGSNTAFAYCAIYVPTGTYLINKTLIVWGDTFFFGEDTAPPILKLANSSANFASPIVQHRTAGVNQSNVTTQAVTLSAAVTTGNYIVALVNCYQSAFVTVTGIATSGGAVTPAFTLAVAKNDTINRDSEIWYAKITTGGIATVTVTFSAAANYNDVTVYEVAGLVSSSVIDATASASGSSTAETVSVTTTNASDVIFASGANNGGSPQGPSVGWNGGATLSNGLAEWLPVNSTGTYAAAVTLSGSGSWATCIAAFKSVTTVNTLIPAPFIVTAPGYNSQPYSTNWLIRVSPYTSTNNTFYIDVHDINFTVGTGNPNCTDVYLFACAQQTSLRNSVLTADSLTYNCLRTDLTGGGGVIQGVTCTGGQYAALSHQDTYELVYRGCTFNGPVIYNGGYIVSWIGCTFNNPGGIGFNSIASTLRFAGLNDCVFTATTGLSVWGGFVPGVGLSGATLLHLENVTWPSLANVPSGLQAYSDPTGKIAQYTNGSGNGNGSGNPGSYSTVYYNGNNVSGSSVGINASVKGTTYANPIFPRPTSVCVNVKSYGATGNGITDDTSSIASAYAASLEVFFPVGTYKVTSTLVLPSGAKMFGHCPSTTIINFTTSTYAISVTGNGSIGVIISGVRLFQAGTGNGILWNGDPSSQVLDVQVDIASATNTAIIMKSGGGVFENMWFPAASGGGNGWQINSQGPTYIYAVQPEHWVVLPVSITNANNVYWINFESELSVPTFIAVNNSFNINIQGVLCGNSIEAFTLTAPVDVKLFGVADSNNSGGVIKYISTGLYYGAASANVNWLDAFIYTSVNYPSSMDLTVGIGTGGNPLSRGGANGENHKVCHDEISNAIVLIEQNAQVNDTYIIQEHLDLTPVGSTLVSGTAYGSEQVVPTFTGTGCTIAPVAWTAGHPGQWQLTTGTLASQKPEVTQIPPASTKPIQTGFFGKLAFRAVVKTPATLPSGNTTANAVWRIGFTDTFGSLAPVNTIEWVFNPNTNAFWSLVLTNGSTATTTASTITVAASTWYDLELYVDSLGVQAKCGIYSVNQLPALLAGGPFTTHQPATTTGMAWRVLGMNGASGTTSFALNLDLIELSGQSTFIGICSNWRGANMLKGF